LCLRILSFVLQNMREWWLEFMVRYSPISF
jgi:hypothetical protein